MKNALLILSLFLISFACSPTKKAGLIPYDPPGATTETKAVEKQKRRVIMAGSPGVFVNNRFPGARISDFWQEDSLFVALVQPELHPINNSAWYAFQLMAAQDTTITLELRYEDGRHRYRPWIKAFHEDWELLPDSLYRVDMPNNRAYMRLELNNAPLVIAAQPIYDRDVMVGSIASFQVREPDILVKLIGRSHLQRELIGIEWHSPNAKWMLPIIARQHPPEVNSNWALEGFVQTLLGEEEQAVQFRAEVALVIVPIANPDGVEWGHWRLNAGGVDLNRDWESFNQPETRAIRDFILERKKDWNLPVLYGFDFHATSETLLYTILPEVKTKPAGLEQQWISALRSLSSLPFKEEAFGIESPIFKNWIVKQFGAGAITFELSDRWSPEQAHQFGVDAARAFMQAYDQFVRK